MLRAASLSLSLALLPGIACASGAFIDHRETLDTSGLYSTTIQDAVPIGLTLASVGCALWQGTETRLGKTCWESTESVALAGGLTLALQVATGRESPAKTDDPGRWLSGGKGSFPSLHVAGTTAAVTPLIFQYVHEQPWIAALALLPAYEMVARVKAQEHWQTDVLAGALLGAGVGYYEYHRNSPLVFYGLPGGAFVGFSKPF